MILAMPILGAALAFLPDRVVRGLAGFALACLVATLVVAGLLWASERRFDLGLKGLST